MSGGTAKFQRLQQRHPNDPAGFTLLYLGSSWLPRDLRALLWAARRRRAPVAVNQNGVAYPGWAGARTDEVNRPLRRALEAATHVVYQSEFCKQSADTFLGRARGTWEVLPNAVDVDEFAPAPAPPGGGPVLLLGGDQLLAYRLELALDTLALVRRAYPEAQLLVTGRSVVEPGPLIAERGLEQAVELVGRYTQAQAPALMRRAHLLLHTKVRDPCPSLVLESMACGVPVVYAASGGTVELVGAEGGIGVPHPQESWDRDEPPGAEALAEAVEQALGRLDELRVAARRRVVERFALGPWLDRHDALFAELLARGG